MISPELALVDPELAALARALLPEIELGASVAPMHRFVALSELQRERELASPAAGGSSRPRNRRAALLAAALVTAALAAVVGTIARGHGGGPLGRKTGQSLAGLPSHAARSAARSGSRSAVSAARHVRTVPLHATGTAAQHTIRSQPSKPRHIAVPKPPVIPVKQHTVTATTKPKAKAAKVPAIEQPLLHWQSKAPAPYYDVVLWRDGHRLLDSWPTVPQLRVPLAWSYGNQHYRLDPGTYLWFVYPGIGARAAAHYGPLLTSGRFTIPPRAGR